jgi:uncharacterized integral membrane protein
MRLSLIAALLLSLLMAFFAVQNSQATHVTFLTWSFEGPLVIVLLLSFAAGTAVALLATLPGAVKKSVEVSRLKSRVTSGTQKIEELEKQLGNITPVTPQKAAEEKRFDV